MEVVKLMSNCSFKLLISSLIISWPRGAVFGIVSPALSVASSTLSCPEWDKIYNYQLLFYTKNIKSIVRKLNISKVFVTLTYGFCCNDFLHFVQFGFDCVAIPTDIATVAQFIAGLGQPIPRVIVGILVCLVFVCVRVASLFKGLRE